MCRCRFLLMLYQEKKVYLSASMHAKTRNMVHFKELHFNTFYEP